MLAVTRLRTISQLLGHQNLFHKHGARNSDTLDTPNIQVPFTEWRWFLLTYLLVCDTVKWNRVIYFSLKFALVKVDAC